jgi:hypothetical protein
VASAAGPAAARVAFTDATAPGRPVVNPSDGDSVTGQVAAEDLADAAGGALTVVVTDQDGEVVASCPVAADGAFNCPIAPPLEDGASAQVVIVDGAGNNSAGAEITADRREPADLAVEPSDGAELGGRGDRPGDQITVTDGAGTVLCETTVKADHTWSCQLAPAASEGDGLTVTETAPTGKQTDRPWRVGLPAVAVEVSDALPGGRQVAIGRNFQPGELVVALISSAGAGGAEVGRMTADESGAVTFEWLVAAEAAPGARTVTLSGDLSGPHQADFNVLANPASPSPVPTPTQTPAGPRPVPPAANLPFTGASGLVGLVGGALGLTAAGWLLILAARRRRQA